MPTGPDRSGCDDEPAFYGIAALRQGEAWAVGSSLGCNLIVKRWNGRRWRPASLLGLPAGAALPDLEARSSHVWAFGKQGSRLIRPLVTEWNGHRWASLPTPQLRGRNSGFDDGEVLASDDIWAAGEGIISHCACGWRR
jgi:hypothetical protein